MQMHDVWRPHETLRTKGGARPRRTVELAPRDTEISSIERPDIAQVHSLPKARREPMIHHSGNSTGDIEARSHHQYV